MHNIDLILTITVGLAVALLFGFFTQKIGLSPIVGYLLAGIVVGPSTPGFVANAEFAEQLAEVGVVLLMFGVGLQFHFKELLAVRRVALPGAFVQSLVATLLGMGVGYAFGWHWSSGLVFGLSIAVASTVVLIRVLADNGDLHTPAGHIAVGWLVVEDILTVVILVVLPVIFETGEGGGAAAVALGIGLTVLKVVVLVLFTVVVGGRLLPWLLEKVAATRSQELFNLSVLVLALGIAVGSTMIFGVSMALGAFLAGMVVGRSDFSLRAATEVLPMRDAFAVLFFVSVGMLFNPTLLLENPMLVLATLGVVLIGKSIAALVIMLVMRYPLKTALSVAVALAQIGEFSFILASVGRGLNVLTPETTNAVVIAAIVSITLNPLLYRMIDPVDKWVERQPRLHNWLKLRILSKLPRNGERPAPGREGGSRYRAVVVGHGPVGRTVSRLLIQNNIEPSIVELNFEAVRDLRQRNVHAVYGEAAHRDTLTAAGVADAESLIISVAELPNVEEVVRVARELNPSIRILARTTYVSQLPALRDIGVEGVFSAEGEIALALTTAILKQLGATSEQIERERERVYREEVENSSDSVRFRSF